jgi:hypothetical protein
VVALTGLTGLPVAVAHQDQETEILRPFAAPPWAPATPAETAVQVAALTVVAAMGRARG